MYIVRSVFFRKSLFNNPCHAPANTEVDECSRGKSILGAGVPWSLCQSNRGKPSPETAKFISLVLVVKAMTTMRVRKESLCCAVVMLL